MKPKIGVMGGAAGNHPKEIKEKAKAIGKAIAKKGGILFYGATIGLPLEAARAAKEVKGTVIGVSPAENEKEHKQSYKYPVEPCDTVIYTGMGLAGGRNIVLVKSCDAIILIGGRIGTMNEFSIAYAAGIPIGILKGSGGFADQVERLEKEVMKGEMPTPITSETNPEKLVEKLLALKK